MGGIAHGDEACSPALGIHSSLVCQPSQSDICWDFSTFPSPLSSQGGLVSHFMGKRNTRLSLHFLPPFLVPFLTRKKKKAGVFLLHDQAPHHTCALGHPSSSVLPIARLFPSLASTPALPLCSQQTCSSSTCSAETEAFHKPAAHIAEPWEEKLPLP